MTVLNKIADRMLDRGTLYTTDELMARLKFIIGICLTLTLMGIIFTILYSVIFVTQPLKGISPIDQKFFEVIIPVASFLCGILSGIMLNGTDQGQMDAMKSTMAGFKEASAQAAKAPEVLPESAPVSKSAPKSVAADGRLTPPAPVFTGEPVAQQAAGVGFDGKKAPPPAPEPEV
jgi:hypothetical protein